MKVGAYTFHEGKEPKDLENEIKKLKKQLKIAVEALENYTQTGYNVAQRALYQIKELENEK